MARYQKVAFIYIFIIKSPSSQTCLFLLSSSLQNNNMCRVCFHIYPLKGTAGFCDITTSLEPIMVRYTTYKSMTLTPPGHIHWESLRPYTEKQTIIQLQETIILTDCQYETDRQDTQMWNLHSTLMEVFHLSLEQERASRMRTLC